MKIRISQLGAAAVVALLVHSFALGQAKQTPAQEPAILLTVNGEVEHPLKLSQADLAKLPHVTVRAKDHDGKDADFEGIALVEILRLAGVPAGEQLRGKNLALYLVVEAADGYRAVFALAELDPGFTDRVVLLRRAIANLSLAVRAGCA